MRRDLLFALLFLSPCGRHRVPHLRGFEGGTRRPRVCHSPPLTLQAVITRPRFSAEGSAFVLHAGKIWRGSAVAEVFGVKIRAGLLGAALGGEHHTLPGKLEALPAADVPAGHHFVDAYHIRPRILES